ncbi:MAG: hypothetical protein JRI90_05275 [Deltaproteobacteria bacterium]|nr:hypothetical protein [Deltaproteobacteria bacterium]
MTQINEIRQFMEEMGIPGRDLYELPDSPFRFPDGAHCRTEIAGVERFSTLKAMIDEMKSRDFVVHRAIATVGGASYCDFNELKEMAALSREEKIEMIMTIGHRLAWDVGSKTAVTSEGQQNGFRLRGSDNVSYYIADLVRCVEAGFRGFLVYDEGCLLILNEMRQKGFLPPETIFKISVFAGYASAAGARVVESMGANTFNPAADLTLPILASIRKAVKIPLDVYLSVPDSFGGMFRLYEAAEVARVAAPVYFKYEPGVSEGEMYKPWVSESWHENHIRQKVKMASIVQEVVGKMNPTIKFSSKEPGDLVLAR